MTQAAQKAAYQQETTGAGESYEMLRRLELGHEAHRHLANYCTSKRIGFLSTAFDEESLDFLVSLGIPLIKVPSGELTNLPYLETCRLFGKPVVLSTGMATLAEIGDALAALEAAGLAPHVTVLHCTTEYPAAMGDVEPSGDADYRECFRCRGRIFRPYARH